MCSAHPLPPRPRQGVAEQSSSINAPQQGCVVHSPGVGGAQPQRPRVSIALFYPHDPARASLVMVIARGINAPAGSAGCEAPRQGCSVFSPGVEEGRKPRRRPWDRSAEKIPLDPARGRTIKLAWGVRHPRGVVSIYDDQPFPGVIGTSCLDTRSKSR